MFKTYILIDNIVKAALTLLQKLKKNERNKINVKEFTFL